MTTNEAVKILETAVARISEHFDAVQIVATWQRDGGTSCIKRGAGNYYARKAMCEEFAKEDDARTLAREMPAPPPDDTEGWKGKVS